MSSTTQYQRRIAQLKRTLDVRNKELAIVTAQATCQIDSLRQELEIAKQQLRRMKS